MDVQVSQCQQFIDRTVKRMNELDRVREVEAARLQEARDRLQQLQQEPAVAHTTAPPVGVSDASPEVAQLRGMVSQLQAQLAKREGGLAGQAMDEVVQESPRANPTKRPEKFALQRPCHQENFVPHCDEEMQEWMEGRHRDLHSAMAAGRFLEVARISSLVTEAVRVWQAGQVDVSDDEIALRTALGEGRFAPY